MNWMVIYLLRKAYIKTGNPDDFENFPWVNYALGEWAEDESIIDIHNIITWPSDSSY